MKKIYKKWEEMAEDFSDFYNIADHILENLGDKEWARKVYKKAARKAIYTSELNCLATSVRKNLREEVNRILF